ncbi:MAG: hypothetical protein ACOCVM_07680 [Desulfovibrionaceae bacterium]
MNDTTRGIEQAIQRMTRVLRSPHLAEAALALPDQEQAPGWWILAVGEPMNEGSLEARDTARNELRRHVEQAGLRLQEFVWVWDETERAQVVVATLPTRDRAERVAERLRRRGLKVRVTPEMD